MPACASDSGCPRFVRSYSDLCYVPRSRSLTNNTLQYPPPTFTVLRRTFSSTFSLIPEEETLSTDPPKSPGLLWRAITWGPSLALGPLRSIIELILHPAWRQLLVVLPTLWIAAWLFVFWKCVQWPIAVIRTIARTINSTDYDKRPRTVLISGGSTIQALQLARNFHTAGARVVACEIDGQFELLKYSAAVERFYTIPKPNAADPLAYTRALCDIVERESVVFFIPVSASSPAYYDALAKPHLELMGCQCFIPGARDVLTFDDPLEVLKVCRSEGLATPEFTVIRKYQDVQEWYQTRQKQDNERYFIASAGLKGARDRLRFVMPEDFRDFRLPRDIGPDRPWVIVHEPRGERFLTCTTLKESRAVNNTTCRLDSDRPGLVPLRDPEVDAWITKFVNRLEPQRPMTGHVSFRLVRDTSGKLMPLGARVCVSLPYLCQTSKTKCRHSETRGVAAVERILDTVVDKREALFAYWDPLPYCAYYKSRQPDKRVPPSPCKTPPNVPL